MPETGETFAEPRPAASVILIRERSGSGEVEVFLMRRHRKASFMSSAFVFPGGVADPGEDDPRVTAAREAFEEVGVLLCLGAIADDRRQEIRQALQRDHRRGRDAVAAGSAPPAPAETFGEMLARDQVSLALDDLHYFAHWITPSLEKKRFSARFYIARMPAGETPVIDNREAVDEVWVTPDEALARSGELRLPPPQVRTFLELAAAESVDAVLELARTRSEHPHPVMPRVSSAGMPLTILLPWDPEYHSAGRGEALAMPGDHPLAVGPSRFVLEDQTWKHIDAPPSVTAD